MIVKLIALTLAYFLVIPFFQYIKNELKRSMSRGNVKKEKSENPLDDLTFQQIASRYRTYGFKEYKGKLNLIIIYIGTILISPIISIFNLVAGIISVIIMPYIFFFINKKMVAKEIEERDNLINRMLQFKKAKMGFVNNKSNIINYEQEFQILENDPDDGKPTKLRFSLPVNFDPLGADKFLADLSTQFGRERPFEIDYQDKDYPGWSTETGFATVKLEAPLPRMAKWSAHYLEDPAIQWSFFPLGLGSKGGVPLKNPETGEIEHVIGIDVDGTQRKYCDKNGIHVGSDIIASPMTLIAGVTGGGKSVAQWNLMNACLARPDKWLLFGMDMKKVELSQLRQFGVAVGTTYEDCADIAVFVQKVMMDRYELMESLGINNWGDLPEDNPAYGSPAILLLCDEAGELLAPIAGKSDEAKAQTECQDLIRAAMESIARLGRAARVFLVAAAQRPSADIIPMQIRQNMSNKLACGTIPSTISGMLFENSEGARIKGDPRGRAAIKIHSTNVNHFQGFFSPGAEWLINYRQEKGLPILIYGEESLANQVEKNMGGNNDFEDGMSEDDFELLELAK